MDADPIYYKRFETEEESCQSVIWENDYYPNCNLFHEFDIGRTWEKYFIDDYITNYESKYISYGYYR